jgi:hypothetical protein
VKRGKLKMKESLDFHAAAPTEAVMAEAAAFTFLFSLSSFLRS